MSVMGSSSPSSTLSNLLSNPQLVSNLFPGISLSSITSSFQAQELEAEQPLNQVNSSISGYGTTITAWQTIQTDLQHLQADAANLAGTSLYQQISASSTEPADVTATGSGSGSSGSYQVAVTGLMQPEIDDSTTFSSGSAPLGFSGSFGINGTTVTVSSSASLSQIASDINAASAGVTATVLGSGSSYVLNLASTEGSAITWSDPSGVLSTDLGLLGSGGTPAHQLQAAAPAQYTINQVSLTSTTNTDTTSIPGVTLDFLGTTSSPATVAVSQNTGAVQSAVQQFVSDFNQFLSDWNTIGGKGGTLEGNATLSGIEGQLVQTLTGLVSGQPSTLNNATEAGLTLSAPVGSPNQLSLNLDSTTLQSALSASPQSFADLWSGTGGIATQIDSMLTTVLGSQGGVTASISGLQEQQSTLQNEISNPNSALNQAMNQQQQALQAQFNNLVQTLGTLSTQNSMITQFNDTLATQVLQGSGTGSGG